MESALNPAGHEVIPDLLWLRLEYYARDHLDFDAEVARPALKEPLSDNALGRIWLIYHDAVAIG